MKAQSWIRGRGNRAWHRRIRHSLGHRHQRLPFEQIAVVKCQHDRAHFERTRGDGVQVVEGQPADAQRLDGGILGGHAHRGDKAVRNLAQAKTLAHQARHFLRDSRQGVGGANAGIEHTARIDAHERKIVAFTIAVRFHVKRIRAFGHEKQPRKLAHDLRFENLGQPATVEQAHAFEHIAEALPRSDLRGSCGYRFRGHHAVLDQQVVEPVRVHRPPHVNGRALAQVDFAFVAGLVANDDVTGEPLTKELLQKARQGTLPECPLDGWLLCAAFCQDSPVRSRPSGM
jgi:hypothetical protein